MRIARRLTSSQRKAQILERATALFSRYGFEKTTIALLAAECHITEPALYRYFPSKKKLYAEVLKSLERKINLGSLAEKIDSSEDIEEVLFLAARGINEAYTKNPEISRLLMYCSLEGHSLTSRVFEIIRTPYTRILQEALERLMKKGLIQRVDAAITARCFIGMVTECAMAARLWKRAKGPTCDPRKNMANTIPIFARGLKII